MSRDVGPAPVSDGITRAQAMLVRQGHAPMEDTLGFALVEIAEGRAVFAGAPGRNVLNPMGIAHGGYAATLLDSACGIALLTRLSAGQRFSTLELKVAYHKAIDEHTGEVRAEGTLMTMGRRIAYAEARLTNAEGRLLASATSTLMIV